METKMKKMMSMISSFLLAGLLTVGAAAQTTHATRFDAGIQTNATQKLAEKTKFQNVKTSVEDGIVTLTGTVNLYQDKLDAAKSVRKLKNVQGVRDLIAVAGPAVTDAQLTEQLSRKIYYDRVGWYDSAFNYFTLGVKDGVVTLGGQTYNDVGKDSALAIVQRMPGVKDVINDVKVSPVSNFDDGLRLRALRAIYGYSALSRYAIDPARPIRIIVDNGHISLYGTVDNQMDKTIAGLRANQLFGAFSVENNLVVDNGSKQGM
jgi:hyperosmotically inducible periplasmic protein